MFKILFALIGVLIFITSLQLTDRLQNAQKLAATLDGTKKSYGDVQGAPLCNWKVTEPDRVMGENKTQAVQVNITNPEKTQCESSLTLNAPNFDTAPRKEEQRVSLPPNKKGSVSWILTPRKTGTYEITVSDVLNTQIFGITVTNVFGMSSAQAKFFSILGSILGPMLTVPWWFDFWRQRKKTQPPPQQNPQEKK